MKFLPLKTTLVLFLLPTINLWSQTTLETCNNDECGSVLVAFSASGQNIFCENATVVLDNTSTTTDFEEFMIDWGDGTIQTIDNTGFPNDNVSHDYAYPDLDRCADGPMFDQIIKYVGFQNCPDGQSCNTGTLILSVRVQPVALFDVPNTICITDPIPISDQSCHANDYLWDFGNGDTSTEENPDYTFPNPGPQNILLTVTNQCGMSMFSQTVNVVAEPVAEFDVPAGPICAPTIITFTESANSVGSTTWSISPDNPTLWCLTDTSQRLTDPSIEVEFKQPEDYIVTLTASNACGTEEQEVPLEVGQGAMGSIGDPPSACDQITLDPNDLLTTAISDADNVEWTFTNASLTSFPGPDFGSVTFTQSGTATLTVTNDCGSTTTTANVTVVANEMPTITTPAQDICSGEPAIVLTANPPGGTWTGTGIITGTDTLDPGLIPPGQATILTYTTGSGNCTNSDQVTITSLGLGAMGSINDPAVACDQATYTPNDLLTTAISSDATSVEWTFTNASLTSFSGPDFGNVTYTQSGTASLTVTNSCGSTTSMATITVTPNEMPTITTPAQEVCSGQGIITLEATPPDGTWSGNGVVTGTDTFDPTLVPAGQSTTLTYTTGSGNCTNTDQVTISITASVPPVISGPQLLCIDGDPVTFTADQSDGMWSGDNIDPTTGTYNPQLAGVGPHVVTYTYADGNNCLNAADLMIEVEALPTVMVTSPQDLCLSDTDTDLNTLFNPVISPTGGSPLIWDGPGVTSPTGGFNPETGLGGPLPVGITTLTYTYTRNACEITGTVDINLTEPQELNVGPQDTIVCVETGATIQLNTNLSGGNWSGTGVDAATGIVQLSALASGGTFTYTYDFEAGTSCARTESLTLEAINLNNGLNAGPDEAFCVGPSSLQLTGQTPNDGTWEGEAVNPSTGQIDLTGFTLDSAYVYRYCVQGSIFLPGCEACVSRTVTVQSRPRAQFSIDGTTCINEDFQLGLDEAQPGLSYDWNFGDGQGSNLPNPTHNYTTPDNYTINLVITRIATGCTDEFSQDIFVSSPPTALFSLNNNNEGCAPFTVDLTNNSFGDNISSQWCIAGDTIDGELPGMIVLDSITQDSFFTIVLKVTNSCGVRTFVDSVLVHPYPIVNYGLSQDDGCSPLTVNLANSTLGNPENCSWNFGNGAIYTDCEDIPSQVYTTPADSVSTYDILMVATNECGEDSLLQTVTVFPPDVSAFISLDTTAGCAPYLLRPCSFSTEGSFLAWELIGPSGSTVNAGNQTCPEFTLTEPGTYTINLGASRCGTAFDTRTFEVFPAPVPLFDFPLTACVDSPVNFSNLSSGISGQVWQFGELQSSNELNPSHVFDSAGTYLITLTVFANQTDCPASISREIEITPLPVAAFSLADSLSCPPFALDITDLSVNAAAYDWSFDFNNAGSNDAEPDFTYSAPGTYEIALAVTDNNSCASDTVYETIVVHPEPVASFIPLHERSCLDYDTLQFLNTSSGDITAQEWLVNGVAGSGDTATYVPTLPGSIDVSITVTNTFGCQAMTMSTETVLASPRSSFTPDLLAGCQPLSVNFANTTTTATEYLWNYGNGTVETGLNGQVTFLTAGTFPVALIASATNGCPADTSTQVITVHPKPTAGFTFSGQEGCGTPASIPFSSTATAGTSHNYTFGDGEGDTLVNPVHTFLEPGLYQTTQVVVNEFACRDTFVTPVSISGDPMALAELPATSGCIPFSLDVTNLSEEALTYQWFVNDELVSTEESPNLSFTEAGDYQVRLIANHGPRCSDTYDLPVVTAYFSPTAAFTAFPDESEIIIGDVRFLNESLDADRYSWNLGDGTFTTEENPDHIYDINGPVRVVLTTFLDHPDGQVCLDSMIQFIDPEGICTFFANNAMSPNYGEADHRVFKPVGLGIETYELAIYSPWGEQVWYTDEVIDHQPAQTWTGEYRGQLVPQGVYVWKAVVNFQTGKTVTYQGEVHVLR